MSQLDINHRRPSSLSSVHHRNINDDDDGTTLKNISARRYGTYELNWLDDDNNYSNDNISDHINHSQNNDTSTNSAQVARWSLPKLPPPTTPLPSIPNEQLRKPTAINTRRRSEPRNTTEIEPQSPFGGITVTTVKVVEILHSPTQEKDSTLSNNNIHQRNSRSEPLNLSADPVAVITSERKRKIHNSSPLILSADPVAVITSERKQKIHNSSPPPPRSTTQTPPPPIIKKKLVMNEDPKMLKQKKHSSILSPQKIKGSIRRSVNFNGKKPEMIIPKEMAFIDSRLLAHKSFIRTPSTNRNRKITVKRGGNVYRKRTLPRNLEFAPTSNPVHSNDPTDMEADLPPVKHQMFPWLPGPPKPPKLLHASLVPLPHRVNRVADVSHSNYDSHIIITNNITKNNVSNNNVSRLLASVNPKRKSKVLSSNHKRLSRVNSQRKRVSIAQNPNRASLVFRRQILEESLMMSFGGMMTGGVDQPQKPIIASKSPIRRKTKKVSNAKIEDRETRRERRRKEKKLAKESQNNASNNNDSVNGQIEGSNIENENDGKNGSEKLEMNRIIESQIIKAESHDEKIYMGPLPPPRKSSRDATVGDYLPQPQRPKNNGLSLLSSPPERRLGKSNGSSSFEPPFPAHLARSTSFFEHTSSKEGSKRKQPPQSPYPLPIGSSISNYSRFMPSPPEENELINNEESQYDIIDFDETSSIRQLPSPVLTPNKPQKIGMGILGLFNKQTTRGPISPPLTSPVLHPTQLPLSPQSPTTPTTPMPMPMPYINNPPQSPPLSPRTLRLPQQLSRAGKSRRGTENGPSSPPPVQDPEKLRKMEQFEALIASSETSSSKKPITEKIKAITTAITTATSSSSSSTMTSNTSFEKRRKAADGTPSNSPRSSSETNSGSYKSGEKESERKNSLGRDSSGRGSLANSVHYRPEEKAKLGKPGDDGVIRVTLTPAVCR